MKANWDMLYRDKYKLPEELIQKAITFSEFANGGAQATIELKNRRIFKEALISNCSYIVAIRGCKEMPFSISDINDVFQTKKDSRNRDRSKWTCWND